jgi:hypothetical protein
MKLPVISRKFTIVIVYLIAQVIIMFAPDNIDNKVIAIAPVAAVVVCVGIAGITLEDSVKAWSERPTSVEDAVSAAFDELKALMFPPQPVPPPQQPSNTVVNVGQPNTTTIEGVG